MYFMLWNGWQLEDGAEASIALCTLPKHGVGGIRCRIRETSILKFVVRSGTT
jgi:hypothetical protein